MKFLAKRLGLGTAAALLAASALLSRLMGLARDKVISWQFGTGSEADLYFAAFVIPDIINYLLAGGFMSITIIPILSACFEKDSQDAWKFFSCIFCWMLLASACLAGLGILLADSLSVIVAPGFTAEQIARLAFFMRIILPAQIFFLCGACFTSLLFIRRQFGVPSLSPLIYNAAIIGCGLLMPMFFPNKNIGMTGYCVGVSIGAFLGSFLLPVLVAARHKLEIRPVLRHPLLGKFLATALPLMLGQTIIMLDEQFLRIFGSLTGTGSVSLLNYGRRIAQVPIGLVGQAMAVASYPFLVALLTRGEKTQFNVTLNISLKTVTAIIIPITMCFGAAAWPVISLIFEGGRFGRPETLLAVPLTRIQLACVPFWTIYMVLVRGYYSMGNTLTPAVTGSIMTLLCLPCYYCLAVPHGPAAIACLSTLSVTIYVLWLIAYWKRNYGPEALTGVARIFLTATLCAAPACIAAWFCAKMTMTHIPFHPLLTSISASLLSGIVFLALFLPLCRRLAPDLTSLFAGFLLKMGKKFSG